MGPQGGMGNTLINLPNLRYGSPLQKINHTDKCLRYFHPSNGSDNHEITAKSQKDLQPLILPFGFVLKSDNFN